MLFHFCNCRLSCYFQTAVCRYPDKQQHKNHAKPKIYFFVEKFKRSIKRQWFYLALELLKIFPKGLQHRPRIPLQRDQGFRGSKNKDIDWRPPQSASLLKKWIELIFIIFSYHVHKCNILMVTFNRVFAEQSCFPMWNKIQFKIRTFFRP